MSYVTDRYNLKKLSGQSLAVTECGIQICHSGHASPNITYREYSAHFILEGKGEYSVNGKTYSLKAGQGFLITPGANCVYVADKQKPWTAEFSQPTDNWEEGRRKREAVVLILLSVVPLAEVTSPTNPFVYPENSTFH